MSSTNTNAKPRGFAAMSPERRREISSKGGVTAHRKGTAYKWNPVTAKDAGRKGGMATRRTKPPGETHVVELDRQVEAEAQTTSSEGSEPRP